MKLNEPSLYFETDALYRQIFPYIESNVDDLINKPIFKYYSTIIIGRITHAWINEDRMLMIMFRLYANLDTKSKDLRLSSWFDISDDGIRITGCNLITNSNNNGPLVGKLTHLIKL